MPLYPAYQTKRPPERQFIELTDVPGDTYVDVRDWLVNHKAIALTGKIERWRYYRDVLGDPRARVYASNSLGLATATASLVSWRIGRKTANLINRSSWPDAEDAPEMLRSVMAAVGVGDYATPGALGQATMRPRIWGKYHTASWAAEQALRAALVGGRAELDAPWSGPLAFENDRRMAYVAECLYGLPVGSAFVVDGPNLPTEYPAYLVSAVVVIHHPLRLGPFPLRLADGSLTYPKEPGTYEDVWLTTMETQDCLAAGCTVIVRSGMAWSRVEPVLATWARWVFSLREQAASEQISDAIKKLAVAAIGWHAMSGSYRRIVAEGTDPENEQIIVTRYGELTGTAWVNERVAYPTQMLAWALWIWARARSTLYKRQLKELESGNEVIASNFDSLVLTNPSALPLAPWQLGAWRETILTNVRIDASRWIVADQEDKRPGKPKRER